MAARLAGSKVVAPVRILSVPCAAGEEPYSIAMTLLDAGITADRFRIDAIDVARYFDDDHYSVQGAREVARALLERASERDGKPRDR